MDADAIIEVSRASAAPQVLDPEQPVSLVVPANARVELPDLSAWRERPTRTIGVYRPATVEAFVEYFGSQSDPDTSTVWVHPTSGAVVGVIDDTSPEAPGWGQHRVELRLAPTPEWLYWEGQDGIMLGQTEYAEHIEGGLEEIQEPDAATMLEIAQTFHATNSAQFRSSTRLATGEQRFQYDEEVKASAGTAGDLAVPTVILLAVAPFFGEDRYKVTARLRFRLNSGKLSLGYKLDRPESVKRDALEGIAERLAEKFPRTYVGDAPSKS